MMADASLAIARALLADMREAALATLDDSGGPFASLVAVAPGADHAPLLLLSGLAIHTRNLARDPRASLLLAEERAGGDGLGRARLTLSGEVARVDDREAARAAFLARHPEAASYAGLDDFSFHRFEIASGHLVAGFGRISRIAPRDLLDPAGS